MKKFEELEKAPKTLNRAMLMDLHHHLKNHLAAAVGYAHSGKKEKFDRKTLSGLLFMA